MYLSAATGEITDEELDHYAGKPITDQIAVSLLEAGSRQCTEDLSAALTESGIEHTTDYLDQGAHGWPMFGRGCTQLDHVWPAATASLEWDQVRASIEILGARVPLGTDLFLWACKILMSDTVPLDVVLRREVSENHCVANLR